MNPDQINFNWLKNQEERKIVAEKIYSYFDDRTFMLQESRETIIESAIEDEESHTADSILRQFKHICVSVWRDDLTHGEPYNDIILQLNEIGNDPIAISEIRDGYRNSQPDSEFSLELIVNETSHKILLNHGRWLDYNFLKVFLSAFNASNTNGKYYAISSDTMDEGVAFIWLSPKEYEEILRDGILVLFELNESYIKSCAEAFYQPFKKPEAFDAFSRSSTPPITVWDTVNKDPKPLESNLQAVLPELFKNIQSTKEAFKLGMTFFDNFLIHHGMSLEFEEDYQYGAAKMSNENCIVDLAVDRYSSRVEIYFENPLNANKYNYGYIMRQKEIFKIERLPPTNNLNEYVQIIQTLRNVEYLMSKYCSEILAGDFSSLSE